MTLEQFRTDIKTLQPQKLEQLKISDRYLHYSEDLFLNIETDEITKLSPNLIILGVQKSGTTSLHYYLDQHPEIFMSKPIKEPGYFLNIDTVNKYLRNHLKGKEFKDKYQLLREVMLKGYNGQKYFGESSTYYTIGRRSTKFDVPRNIFNTQIPKKFIYIIRNPFERIISNYLHIRQRNYSDLSLNEYLRKKVEIFQTSLYFSQLKPYLSFFSNDMFKILFFEDLVEKPSEVMSDVFEFLEVDADYKKINFRTLNKSSNRLNFNKEDLLFTPENYDFLIQKINHDLQKLEGLINSQVSTKWDLSRESWCIE